MFQPEKEFQSEPVLSSSGAGPSSDSGASSAPDPTSDKQDNDPSEKSFSDRLRGIAQQAKETGQRAWNRVEEFAEDAGATVKLAGAAAKETAVDLGTRAGSAVAAAGETVRDATVSTGKAAAEYAHNAVRDGLETIAHDPSKPSPLKTELIKAAPFIGAGQSYANAWKKYHQALGAGDADKMREGRIECLVALMDLGVDVTAFGPASRFLRGIAIVERGVQATKSLRLARFVSAARLDIFRGIAERVADAPRAIKLADSVLRVVKPGATAGTKALEQVAKDVEATPSAAPDTQDPTQNA